MSGDSEDFELKMPFVVVKSVGGPFDDAAYTAGWEMGKLSARLEAARHFGLGLPSVTIRRENVKQADLLAMDVGAAITVDDFGEHETNLPDETMAEWAFVSFCWVEP